MLKPQIVTGVPKFVRRNIGILAPVLQKTSDPIQQLFIDKIREYKNKSSSGKLDMSPELQKIKAQEMEKLSQQYGANAGVDMTKFPTLSYKEPKVDPTANAAAK